MSKSRWWLLQLVLAGLCVGAYARLGRNDFIDYDDVAYITGNPYVTQGFTRDGFAWAWTTFHASHWLPVTWLSLQFDAHFFSGRGEHGVPILSPAAFHLDNLAWHTATVLVLCALWRRLTGAVWRSFLVAALFAVHPLHVESVAWATERKDVLSVFFGVVTIWAYLGYVNRPEPVRYLAILAAFTLALLSKPMLVTLPCLLLLLDYWPLGRVARVARSEGSFRARNAHLVTEKLPLFALAAGACALAVVAQQSFEGTALSFHLLPWTDRLANTAAAYGWYLAATFWPQGLMIFYPHPLHDWSLGSVAWGTMALGGITLICLVQARRQPWLIVGWLWFLVALAPVIGLVQSRDVLQADRYTYWPHIGLFVAVVWTGAEILRNMRIAVPVQAALAAVVLGALAATTWCQVGVWQDSFSLWQHVLEVDPTNQRAHCVLGENLFVEKGQLNEARKHFEQAIALQPRNASSHALLGLVLWQQDKRDEAGAEFRTALALQPNCAPALDGQGMALLWQGKNEQAADYFRKAIAGNPERANPYSNLGVALARQGKLAQARENHGKAVLMASTRDKALRRRGIEPPRQGAIPEVVIFRCRLAQVLTELGGPYQIFATASYDAALETAPAWPREFCARAWKLAAAPDPRNRDPVLALELASQAWAGQLQSQDLMAQARADPPACFLDVRAIALYALWGRGGLIGACP